jgi:hypothetical protein
MKQMSYEVSGENREATGCFRCENNGDFIQNGRRLQEKNYVWGSAGSKSLSLSYEGWENDHGDRCHYGGVWYGAQDDCHEKDNCTATITENKNGQAHCHGSHHGMTVEWAFNREAAAY